MIDRDTEMGRKRDKQFDRGTVRKRFQKVSKRYSNEKKVKSTNWLVLQKQREKEVKSTN